MFLIFQQSLWGLQALGVVIFPIPFFFFYLYLKITWKEDKHQVDPFMKIIPLREATPSLSATVNTPGDF